MWKMRYYTRRYDTPATYVLLAATAAGFVVDFFTQQRLTEALGWPPTVGWLHGGELWRPFTFPFVHAGSVLWALFDGILLFWFGA